MRVQDCNGREIIVGTTVVYGDDADQTAEVVAISDPDVLYNPETDSDDGGYAVDITIRFADGDTEKLQAKIASAHEEIFEEPGDLEVVAT